MIYFGIQHALFRTNLMGCVKTTCSIIGSNVLTHYHRIDRQVPRTNILRYRHAAISRPFRLLPGQKEPGYSTWKWTSHGSPLPHPQSCAEISAHEPYMQSVGFFFFFFLPFTYPIPVNISHSPKTWETISGEKKVA